MRQQHRGHFEEHQNDYQNNHRGPYFRQHHDMHQQHHGYSGQEKNDDDLNWWAIGIFVIGLVFVITVTIVGIIMCKMKKVGSKNPYAVHPTVDIGTLGKPHQVTSSTASQTPQD